MTTELNKAVADATDEICEIACTNHVRDWPDKNEQIIQHLFDEKDAEIEQLNDLVFDLKESKEILSIAVEVLKKARVEVEWLKKLLDRAQEYLVDLRGAWSWRKDEPRNRNAERYSELDSFIGQLVEVVKEEKKGK